MQGLVPGGIGVTAIALVRMIPHAAPDPLAIAVLIVMILTLLVWRVALLKAMLGGSVFGLLRDRICEVPGIRTLRCANVWAR